MCWWILAVASTVPAVIGWALTAFYAIDNAAGTDMTVDDGAAPAWVRVLAVLGIIGALVLPWFVARWARKVWLGYFLLGIVLTMTMLVVGLMMFRIL